MRILSGIQPSGALHLGNYFGMMKPAIELQEKGEAFYFIANYHSMTSLFDPAERRKNTLDVALDFLACGLDPKKTVFFKQSDVPEVTESEVGHLDVVLFKGREDDPRLPEELERPGLGQGLGLQGGFRFHVSLRVKEL